MIDSKISELKEKGMTGQEIADQLTSDGYANRYGQVSWSKTVINRRIRALKDG